MKYHTTHRIGTALSACIVLWAGWSALAEDEVDRPAPPPAVDDIDEGGAPVDGGPALGGPRPESRMRDREREGDEPWRPRRGPGFNDDGRGERRGWRESDEGDRSPRPPRGDRADLPPLTEQQIEILMERVREHMPELHEKMSQLREKNPEQFKHMAERVRHVVLDMGNGREDKRPPIPFEFIREMRRLAEAYRTADSGEHREEIRSKMRGRLREHIDRRQEELREEIRHMEARLAEMKKNLSEFEANQDERVDEFLEKILSGEGFGPPPGRGPRDREHMPPDRDLKRDFERGGPRSRPAGERRDGGDRPKRNP